MSLVSLSSTIRILPQNHIDLRRSRRCAEESQARPDIFHQNGMQVTKPAHRERKHTLLCTVTVYLLLTALRTGIGCPVIARATRHASLHKPAIFQFLNPLFKTQKYHICSTKTSLTILSVEPLLRSGGTKSKKQDAVSKHSHGT